MLTDTAWWILLLGAGALALALALTLQGPAPGPKVVPQVDLERYAGRWYAIAHIPTWFERGCASGTTATYTLLPDGAIEVVNECFDSQGRRKVARGRAWLPNPDEPAKLKVSFFKLFGRWLFPGNYWILALGPDYSYAVVGDPKRRYGWVLSRTPTLPKEALEEIKAALAGQGYDWSRFRLIDQ